MAEFFFLLVITPGAVALVLGTCPCSMAHGFRTPPAWDLGRWCAQEGGERNCYFFFRPLK